MVTLEGASLGYRGLSTDTKPSDADKNTTFLEMDTGKIYYFDGTEWLEFGTGADALNANTESRDMRTTIAPVSIDKRLEDIDEFGGDEDEQSENESDER